MDKSNTLDKTPEKPCISMIAALGTNRALGKDGELLYRIPDDLKRFKELTMGHSVVMGRKTWESLPDRARPLSGRTNIVVTRQSEYRAEGATVAHSLEDALAMQNANEVFIIGGAEIYAAALPFVDRLYLTLIDDKKEGDTYFPAYEHLFTKKLADESRESNGLKYRWVTLER